MGRIVLPLDPAARYLLKSIPDPGPAGLFQQRIIDNHGGRIG